jgi:hypothetical protein
MRKRVHLCSVKAAAMDLGEHLILIVLRVFKVLRLNGLPRFLTSTHQFTDYFKGFQNVETVRQLFGEETEQVLRSLKVEFTMLGGYMWVSNTNGHIVISTRYLATGNKVDIYLDIIHELVHVKQFRNGRELFDSQYEYVERPTEVEAYRYTMKEAKRLGLSNKRIREYLEAEWMSEADLKRLTKILNLGPAE